VLVDKREGIEFFFGYGADRVRIGHAAIFAAVRLAGKAF
jgi:hypothetical protein